MAGHSKWANIKHRKDAVDRKRGRIFTRLAREIMVSARLGGADVSSNPRLRIAINKARANNMPNENIERAVKKGTGDVEGMTFEEAMYEAYAAGGVGILVEALTDKKSRTTPEIKNILNKAGGSLAEPNAVSRLFQRVGYMSVPAAESSEEQLMEIAVEAGADDIQREEGYFTVLTPPDAYSDVSEALAEQGIPTENSGVRFIPLEGTDQMVEDAEQARKLLALIEKLEDHDDVQAVYHNMDAPDSVWAALQEE